MKRILGIADCRCGTYQTDDGTVSISFSDETCKSGWNVPPGTVLSLHVNSRTQQKFASIVSDASKYIKSVDPHVRYVTYYENKDEGVTIAVFEDGTVANNFYGPSAKDSALRCPSLVGSTPTPRLASKKLDEFGVLTKKEEELRLNDFATALNTWTDVSGYIVAYTGWKDGADGLSRAARIKAYLVNQGVAEAKVSMVDGGIKEESTHRASYFREIASALARFFRLSFSLIFNQRIFRILRTQSLRGCLSVPAVYGFNHSGKYGYSPR